MRLHINPETGKSNPCNPKNTGICKYAEDGVNPPHYDSKEEAEKAYEEIANKKFGATKSLSKSDISKIEKNFAFKSMLYQDDPHSAQKKEDYEQAYKQLAEVSKEAQEKGIAVKSEAERMKHVLDTQKGNTEQPELNNKLLSQLEDSRNSLPNQTLLWTDVPKYREISDDHSLGIKKASLEKVTQILEAEKEVTSILVSSKPEGAEFEKAFFRVKSPAAVAAKVKRNLAKNGLEDNYENSKKETESMKDVLRYTYKVDVTDDLTKTIQENIKDFEKKGFTCVKASNSFVENVSFKGFITTWETNKGETFELQYSTSEASAVKTQAHKQYEISRDETQTQETRQKALMESKKIFSNVPNPKNIEKITKIGKLNVEQWSAE